MNLQLIFVLLLLPIMLLSLVSCQKQLYNEGGNLVDRDDGVTVYEVSFKSGNLEYDYEINAATGAILKAESDRD